MSQVGKQGWGGKKNTLSCKGLPSVLHFALSPSCGMSTSEITEEILTKGYCHEPRRSLYGLHALIEKYTTVKNCYIL